MLDVIEEEGLVERAARIGETIRARMLAWQDALRRRSATCAALGAMLAIELVRDRATREPAPELATAVVERGAERGLLLLKAGIYGNVIRVLAPLVITDAELDEALDVWEEALDAALAGAGSAPHLGSGEPD